MIPNDFGPQNHHQRKLFIFCKTTPSTPYTSRRKLVIKIDTINKKAETSSLYNGYFLYILSTSILQRSDKQAYSRDIFCSNRLNPNETFETLICGIILCRHYDLSVLLSREILIYRNCVFGIIFVEILTFEIFIVGILNNIL